MTKTKPNHSMANRRLRFQDTKHEVRTMWNRGVDKYVAYGRPALSILLVAMAGVSIAQTTQASPRAAQAPSLPITFSEFALGTHINTQYAPRGVLFGGDSPFISPDSSNPTAPVLSGTPQFAGTIACQFVDPADGVTPVGVSAFMVDAGYFDEIGSTRIEWFDLGGASLGQVSNSSFGIQHFEISGGSIASWRISIFANRPNGFAIDNLSFIPLGPSVIFRERDDDHKDGSWGFNSDEIPGWDHCAFHTQNAVYESHPVYPPGTYLSADGSESAAIAGIDGVQGQFTRATFLHDSMVIGATNVIATDEVPISEALAGGMLTAVQGVLTGHPFHHIDFSFPGILSSLAPDEQKGASGTFTCVGLVEWSAEQSGHHAGQGFVPNILETIPFINPTTFPPELVQIPTLSPSLLRWCMLGSITIDSLEQLVQGVFDPVDFYVTDPLGRQLGYAAAGGAKNEIPGGFYTGTGSLEQFLIRNGAPGDYVITLFGLDSPVVGAMSTRDGSVGVSTTLPSGSSTSIITYLPPSVGAPGDVDRDGTVTESDNVALALRLNTFAIDSMDPGDLNGDGLIDLNDVGLLQILIQHQSVLRPEIVVNPRRDGRVSVSSDDSLVVVVLSTPEFHAEAIDRMACRLGPGLALPSVQGLLRDLNHDGRPDLVLKFATLQAGLALGVNTVRLSGRMLSGARLAGDATIITLP